MADPSSPAGPSSPAADAESERRFGLLLFEAEECLARGNVEKAAVHASRAVRERPESLTARSLLDRARRELTRGRRRERLEERVVEARERLARGEDAAAEKIVTTVLKLLPDHAAALQLFAVLKDRRLRAGTAEAEAERELDGHGALAGAPRRRVRPRRPEGGMVVPRADDRPPRAGHHPRRSRAARPLRGEPCAWSTGRRRSARSAAPRTSASWRRGSAWPPGMPQEAARILRAVLKEDPQNREALEALGSAGARGHAAPARPIAGDPTAMTGKFSHRALARGHRPAAAAVAGIGARAARPVAADRDRRRRRRRSSSWASLALHARRARGRRGAAAGGRARASSGERRASSASPPRRRRALFAGHDPALREAVEDVLARYGRALETIDAGLLAEARPDLGAKARRDLIAEREGATKVATDLRVLDVARRGNQASVTVRRTEVVVAGRSVDRPSVEETLRFQREGGAWVLRPSR